jgi:hypothetical protein
LSIAVTAKDTAVSFFGFELFEAVWAIVKKQAGIFGHRYRSRTMAKRAGDDSLHV